MKNLLSFALGLLASACIASAADVKVLMWSDYIDPDIQKQFKELTGQEVKVDVYEDTESMMAKLSGPPAAIRSTTWWSAPITPFRFSSSSA